MKGVLEALRAIFVSFEFMALAVVVLAAEKVPEALVFAAKLVAPGTDYHAYVMGWPVACLSASIYYGQQILFPRDAEIAKWPLFWALKLRVVVSIAWCALAALAALIALLLASEVPATISGGLVLSAVAVSVISATHILMAAFVVREIVQKSR